MFNEVTPTTKRICIICLAVISVAALAGAAFTTAITFDNAALIVIPSITSISAMVDGGK